jgi:phosphoglycerate kinase
LPSYAGLNVELELKALGRVAASAEHPSLFMLGGAKISDKVATVQNLGKKVDSLLVGGGPANLFFFAKGYEVGKSICERESVQLAKDVLRNFGDKLVLPVDCVVAKADHSSIRVCAPTDVHPDEAIFDIGPASILKFAETIKAAKQMVWNGPLGLFEERAFSHGSVSIATLFAARCQGMAFGVVGGGDTLSLLDAAQVTHMVDFVSTAGGAMLAYLAGEPLPAIVALGSQNKE